jgi:hypothetical protein
MGPDNKSDGGFVISGANQALGMTLIQYRSALGLEIRSTSGMVASRHMNARTIIPRLYEWSITDVLPKYSKKKKIQAYNDLNKFLVEHGFEDKPLDLPKKSK